MPFPRHLRPRVQLVERLAAPQPAGLKIRRVAIYGHRVGAVGLQLDRVGPGLGGHLDQPQRPLKAAVVVRRQLGDDVRRMATANPTLIDRDGMHVALGATLKAAWGRPAVGRPSGNYTSAHQHGTRQGTATIGLVLMEGRGARLSKMYWPYTGQQQEISPCPYGVVESRIYLHCLTVAMRLYTEEEFKEELRAYGLRPTKSHSKGYRLWETEDGLSIHFCRGTRDCRESSLP